MGDLCWQSNLVGKCSSTPQQLPARHQAPDAARQGHGDRCHPDAFRPGGMTQLSTWSWSRFSRGVGRACPRGVGRAPIMIPIVRTDRFPIVGRQTPGITRRPVTWTKSRSPTAPNLPIKRLAPTARIGPNASWQIRYFTPARRSSWFRPPRPRRSRQDGGQSSLTAPASC
jgi:hypothetical protein